jgi:hypothetical protein
VRSAVSLPGACARPGSRASLKATRRPPRQVLGMACPQVAEEEHTSNKGHEPDRDVARKDRLPGEPEGVRRDQHAAKDLVDNIGETEGSAAEVQLFFCL